MRHLRVTNFERYQHYKDRNPPWVKLYNSLLDDYHFCMLQDASKLLAICLTLLASRNSNHIPADPEWIAKRLSMTTTPDLDSVLTSGFVEFCSCKQCASKTLARRKRNACSETETETETEKSQSLKTETDTHLRPTRPEFREDFAIWVATLRDGSRVKPTETRWQRYKARRGDCDRQEIREALQGWRYDPWSERVNHNDFDVLLRDRAQVEKFSKLFRESQPKAEPQRKDGDEHFVTGDLWSSELGQWVDAKDWKPARAAS